MDDFIDDDFGYLYADVEAQASSAIASSTSLQTEPPQKQEDDDIHGNADGVKTHTKEKNLPDGSDSEEDDLNIVLNDEDFKGLLVRNGNGVGFEEFEDDNDAGFVGLRREIGNNGLASCSPNGHGGERGNSTKGDYNIRYLQHQHGRTYELTYASNRSEKESEMAPSCSTKYARGDWDDNRCKVLHSGLVASGNATSNLVVPRVGYGFSLPWYRTILDMNIDAFQDKRWRYPGAEISDFFNFGFNEDSWKQYCLSMEQLRQQSHIHSRAHLSPKTNRAYIRSLSDGVVEKTFAEDVTLVGSFQKYKKGESKLELPKGRPINVQDSSGEREPFMGSRRPCDWDSDVVIKINVQNSSKYPSWSCKKKLGTEDSSGHEIDAGDTANVHTSDGTFGDEFSAESLEGNIRCSQPIFDYDQKPMDLDEHENCKISEACGFHQQKEDTQASEDNDDILETVKKTEEDIDRNKSYSNQCLVEAEILLGNWSNCGPSFSCTSSDSEASGDNDFGCTKDSCSPLQSSPSCSELLDLVGYDQKSPTHNSGIRKSGSCQVYPMHRRPNLEEGKDKNSRPSRVAQCRINQDNYNPMSRVYSPPHKSRYIERLHDFDSHSSDCFTFCRERDLHCGYGGEKFDENHVHSTYTKHPYRKYGMNFRDEVKSRDLTWNKEYSNGRSPRLGDWDNIVNESRELHSFGRGPFFEDMVALTHKESRQLASKYIKYNLKHGDSILNENITDPLSRSVSHKHEDDSLQEKYGRYVSFTNQKKACLDERRKHCRSLSRRQENLIGKRFRYTDDCPMDLHGMNIEDEHQFTSLSYINSNADNGGGWQDRMSLTNDMHRFRLKKKYGKHERKICGDGFHGFYNDSASVDNILMYPDEHVHLGRRKFKALRKEQEKFSRCGNDEFYAEEESYSYGGTARHENGVLVDYMQFGRHRCKMIREYSWGNFVDKNRMVLRGEHQQMSRQWKSPVDLIFENGKPAGRFSNGQYLMQHSKIRKVDLKVAGKQTVLEDFSESHEGKAIHTGIQKAKVMRHDKKWLGKIPATEKNLDLDIEQGQIVTEEPIVEDKHNHGSERTAALPNVKKKLSTEMVSGVHGTAKEYDKQKILETLAKMEKRRERFKDPPILLNKEADKTPIPQDNLIVDTVDAMQERPFRKRRWGGG